jgi:stage V sporulation protein D (sporulation-specific penicillin-binding protein)
VVSEGGSHKAFIDGYHIAGKTGTAQKPGVGGYQQGRYISSFAGMAPADKPQVTVFVSIDEPDPSNYYAGQIAAPVAKQVFNDIFNYLAIDVDASSEEIAKSMRKDVVIPELRGMKKDAALKALKELKLSADVDAKGDFVVEMNPKPGYTLKEGDKLLLYTGTAPNYNKVVVVPELVGLNKTKAQSLLNNLGLKADFTGEGLVSKQSIDAGKQVDKGTTLLLELDIIED